MPAEDYYTQEDSADFLKRKHQGDRVRTALRNLNIDIWSADSRHSIKRQNKSQYHEHGRHRNEKIHPRLCGYSSELLNPGKVHVLAFL
ncbi:hypothetical protein HMPREF0240_03016 [Clostridium sp. D5]|nr:hypothetical protein HMPREF0240_03016 [Clostridium sp. D5]